MIKPVVNAPTCDRTLQRRMDFQGLDVVGGVSPTGHFPRAVGSGIFGIEGQDDGVFSGPQVPHSGTGIFYNDYAKDSLEVAQPDMEWVLLRRPGAPLYPGSDARGIVLVGPSMGNDVGVGSGSVLSTTTGKVVAGAACAALGWYLYKKYRESREEV